MNGFGAEKQEAMIKNAIQKSANLGFEAKLWFAADNVFLSPDHLPYLQKHFATVRIEEHRAKVPYIPLIRVPYYTFVGRHGSQ